MGVFKILKVFFAAGVALFVTAQLVPGISYQGDFRVLLAAALIFAVLHAVVKPIISFLTLPLNFLTLGLMSTVINIGIFYAINYLVPSFTLSSLAWGGYTLGVAGTVVVGALVAAILLGLFEKILNV